MALRSDAECFKYSDTLFGACGFVAGFQRQRWTLVRNDPNRVGEPVNECLGANRTNLAVAGDASHGQAAKLVGKHPAVHSSFAVPEDVFSSKSSQNGQFLPIQLPPTTKGSMSDRSTAPHKGR